MDIELFNSCVSYPTFEVKVRPADPPKGPMVVKQLSGTAARTPVVNSKSAFIIFYKIK
jgi:hypothetical protein